MTAPRLTPAAALRHALLVSDCRRTERIANRVSLALAGLAALWIVLPALCAAMAGARP